MWELFVTAFFPPNEANPEQIVRWRRSIAIVLLGTGGLTIVNTMTMFGMWPISLVFSGFATVASVQTANGEALKLEKQIQGLAEQVQRGRNEDRALMLLGQLNQVFDAMCGAKRNNRLEESRAWERQFNDLLIQYQRVSNGMPYPMRVCS